MTEQRYEPRKRFVEGEGWLVEQVPVGVPLDPGQSVVKMLPDAPPQAVTVISVETVPLLVALQVVETNGMVAVPRSFFTEEQLEELARGSEAENESAEPAISQTSNEEEKPEAAQDVSKLPADQAITRVKLAESFEELNAMTANEERVTVLRAAEERAAELKGGD
jgi:hypothetical protein